MAKDATAPLYSPLPWKTVNKRGLVDRDGETIVFAENAAENAAFIVHRVNTYNDLLEALKALVARAEREMVDPIDVGEIQYAKDVITKAEGR